MGVPMIKCAICGSEITKRSSLMVDPYGRICRSHPEVEAHKAKLAEIAAKQSENKKLEEGLKNLQVIMLVEQLRMMAFTSGHSLELTLFAFSHRLPQSIRSQVESQVRERGPLTAKEVQDSIGMAMYLASKGHL